MPPAEFIQALSLTERTVVFRACFIALSGCSCGAWRLQLECNIWLWENSRDHDFAFSCEPNFVPLSTLSAENLMYRRSSGSDVMEYRCCRVMHVMNAGG